MRTFIIVLFSLASLSLRAQTESRNHLQLYTGFATSRIVSSTLSLTDTRPITTLPVGADVSFGLGKHLFVSCGLGFISTGYKHTVVQATMKPGSSFLVRAYNYDTVTAKVRFHHLLIPVRVGYNIHAGKIDIRPSIGVAGAFNINIVHAARSPSLMGIGNMNFCYSLNNNLALLVGGSYYRSLTNVYTDRYIVDGFVPIAPKHYHEAFAGNIGVQVKL